MSKKLWRSPVCEDAHLSGDTPPKGFQLHLSEQVKGHDINRAYICRMNGGGYA